MSTGKKVFLNARLCPGSSLAMAAGMGSSHLGCTTAATVAACCKISADSYSKQPRKLICIVKVIATRKDTAQHYKRTMLEFSRWTEWNEKGSNSRKGEENKSVDSKMAILEKGEGV